MALNVTTVGENPQVPSVTAYTFVPDQLIAGGLQLVTKNVTLASGTLQRGTVLGKVTATGFYVKSVASASDGSQAPAAILADYADASAGTVVAGVYLMGEFNIRSVIYDASFTAATATDALRPLGIFLKSSVSAADPT